MAPNLLKYALNQNDTRPAPIKSKVMFAGKYKDELGKLVDMLDAAFEAASCERFTVDSVHSGKTNLRIRLTDPELWAQMIVNCVLWYHHSDERYGYINIDLVTSGLWQKGKTHFVWAFGVLDHATIKEKVLNDLAVCVKF